MNEQQQPPEKIRDPGRENSTTPPFRQCASAIIRRHPAGFVVGTVVAVIALIAAFLGQGATIHVDTLDMDFDGFVESLPGASGARYSLLPPENATGNYVKVVQRLPVRIRFKAGRSGLERLGRGCRLSPKYGWTGAEKRCRPGMTQLLCAISQGCSLM